MCRSRPSLPRAALFSLPHRRRITLHALLFSASSARTVLFLLFSCSSSVVLRRTQPQGGITGTAWPDRAHQRVRRDPLRRGGPLKGGRRLFKAPPRQLHVADNGGLLTAPNPCTPLERGRKRLAQPTVIQKAYQCLVRHVSRLQVDGRAARRSRQASEILAQRATVDTVVVTAGC